jgi:apurinic endonuclease APN1
MMRIGAHFSSKGEVMHALNEAHAAGANALALFVSNQRTWRQSPLSDVDAQRFRRRRAELDIAPSHIIPHGSYLMNLGSFDDALLAKSRAHFLYELRRCEQLGLELFNFHPGSTLNKITVDTCICRIADSINEAHRSTNNIVTVLENVAGQGSSVGKTFEELRDIIDKVEDKKRVGVCIDTCHA